MLSVHLFRQWLSQMGIFIESVIYLLILKNWQPDDFQTICSDLSENPVKLSLFPKN